MALREARLRAGLSQSELADRAGTSQVTVSNLERGKGRRIDLDIIERLASVLGVSPLELLGESAAPKRPKRRR